VSTTDNLSVWFLHVRSTSSSRYADVYEIAYTDGASAVTLRVDHDHDKCATLTDTARAEHAEARRHGIPTSRSDAAWTILKDLTQPRPGTGRQPVIVTTDATHTIAVLDRLARLGGVGELDWPRVIDLGDLAAGYACGAHTVAEEPLTDWTNLRGLAEATGANAKISDPAAWPAINVARYLLEIFEAIEADTGGRHIRGEQVAA
jgi:hypothetical protein